MKLKKVQQQFIDFLLHGDEAIREQITERLPVSRDIGLSIYANAYQARLRECLDTDHQVLGIYMGDELFDQMVKTYVKKHPSTFRSLRLFANHLPEFLRKTTPFSEYPQLAELAAFERALMASFDAADGGRADESALADLSSTQWPDIRLGFHPSVQLFKTEWNTVTIWQALKADKTPPDADSQENTWWLLWRDDDRLTQFRYMENDEFLMIHHFLSGGNFAGACEFLQEQHKDQDAAQRALQVLVSWLQSGVISKLL